MTTSKPIRTNVPSPTGGVRSQHAPIKVTGGVQVPSMIRVPKAPIGQGGGNAGSKK